MTNDTNPTEIKNEIHNDELISDKRCNDKMPIKTSIDKKGFDVDLICKAFEEFNSHRSLPLDHYITGYKELLKFFDNMGTIFSFVASDVDSKLLILDNYRRDDKNGDHYCDLQTMIDYERDFKLLQNNENGCRTLLRLHRALQFISEFLNEVTKLDEDENTSHLAKQVYERTLMKYHSWLISKGAKLALLTLPRRSVLVERVFHHNKERMNRDQINESMLRISKLTEQAFNSTQKLYEDNNLLDLP